jgi:hypothetical protein
MSNVDSHPPRLAPALTLSGLGALGLLGFMIELGLGFFVFAPIMNLMHSAYYLYRLSQRHSVLIVDQAASDAWPYTVLFPGKQEREQYAGGASFITLAYISFGFSIAKIIFGNEVNASQPQVTTIIIFGSLYVAQCIACFVVSAQASRVLKKENQAMCMRSHVWTCLRCRVEESKAEEVVLLPPLAVRHPRIGFTLATSTTLSIALICLMYNQQWTGEMVVFYMAVGQLTLAILHHTYFGGRLLRIRHIRRSGEVWPSTPMFPGLFEATTYIISTIVLWELNIAIAFVVFMTLRELGSFTDNSVQSVLIVALCLLEIFVLGQGALEACRLGRAEKKARCAKEGHSWKCSRLCSATKEATGIDVEKVCRYVSSR